MIIIKGAPPLRRDVPKFDYSDAEKLIRSELASQGYSIVLPDDLRKDARKNDKKARLLTFKSGVGSAHMTAGVLWPLEKGDFEFQYFEDPHSSLPQEVVRHFEQLKVRVNPRPINYLPPLHSGKFKKPRGRRRKPRIEFSDWIKDSRIYELRREGKMR